MEKIMSVEEKIRRAEEIYNRRNGNEYIYKSPNSNEKKEASLMNRMIKQIIICFLIYCIFYTVTNKEYFLSADFQSKVQEVASQNEYLNKAYNYVIGYVGKYLNLNENDLKEASNNQEENNTQNESDIKEGDNSQEKNNTEQNDNQQNKSDSEQNNNSQEKSDSEQNGDSQDKSDSEKNNKEAELKNNEENIGGADEKIANEEKTQEQKDVEEIKNTISFIVPVKGTISSTFGWRTPTTATVPKNHTGLDIAAASGTIIKSATDGEVILASSQGDYGNHYKIKINDVIIIYAHCSKLYLKEGDKVHQGQEIAEVGSTGNSTRSTLAF